MMLDFIFFRKVGTTSLKLLFLKKIQEDFCRLFCTYKMFVVQNQKLLDTKTGVRYYITSLSRGQPFSTPLQAKCIQNVSKNIVVFEGFMAKNRAKTHDIWHSLTRGQLHVQPPCKRVDLPPYLFK
ncbi:Hypothetical_protein [Hexamita inflata]|uniref:Hypothetical_protein n=1 Tax=Hexamita inflata TaxID=28002 RepID=A0AA86RC77_9EUKA|nr:Hypothetical protein HINF_LOCUS62480 [Hexamita inflata]